MRLDAPDHAFARFREHGRPDDLAAVFDATAVELHRVARHLAGSADEADDLVQATFLTAIESRENFTAGEPVLPWLLGILANRARRLWRGRRRRPDPTRLSTEAPLPDPADTVEVREITATLRNALAALPEPYGSLLDLHLAHGLSAAEIAAHVERPAGSIRKQLSRGLDRLRQTLPASLAGGAATASTSLGDLAAVRGAVMAEARRTAPAAVLATATGSLVSGSKLVLGGAALVLTVGVSLWVARPEAVSTTSDRAPTTVAAGAAATEHPARGSRSAAEPAGNARDSLRRTPAPVTPGADEARSAAPVDLAITVVAADTNLPVEDYRIRLNRAPDWEAKANAPRPLVGVGIGARDVSVPVLTDVTGDEAPRFVEETHHPGGRYDAAGLGSAAFCVQVFPLDPGLLPSELRVVDVEHGAATEARFRLAAASTRTLRTLGEDGLPVSGAHVELLRGVRDDPPTLMSAAVRLREHPEHRPHALLVQSGETDADGRFELRGPQGELAVRITATDHAPAIVQDVVLGASPPLEVHLERGASIDGEIDGAAGLFAQPAESSHTAFAPGVRLRDDGSGIRFPLDGRAPIEREGRFHIANVPSGTWQVVLHYAVAQPGTVRGRLLEGSTTIATVTTTAAASLRVRGDVRALEPAVWSGRVTVDGAPWEFGPSSVRFEPMPADGRPRFDADVGRDGRYAVRLVPGDYAVRMTGSAPAGLRRYPLRLGARDVRVQAGLDTTRDIEFATAPLVLQLLSADGTPAAGRPVDLEVPACAWFFTARADDRGIVRLPRLPRAIVTVTEPPTSTAMASGTGEGNAVQEMELEPIRSLGEFDLRDGGSSQPIPLQLR